MMSELERLDEALAFYGAPDSYTGHEQQVLDAARAYQDLLANPPHPKNRSCERTEEVLDNYRKRMMDAERLLANGQRVEWCEGHEASSDNEATPMGAVVCWKALKGMGHSSECRIVSKLLSVYPKEAENE